MSTNNIGRSPRAERTARPIFAGWLAHLATVALLLGRGNGSLQYLPAAEEEHPAAAEEDLAAQREARKELIDLLKKDHENALEEANSQAKQQFTLNQLFVTVLFAAFGLAFEMKIEPVFAILPLFGGMCLVSLYWKGGVWYLAIKRVVEIEEELDSLLGSPTLTWGRNHGETEQPSR